MPVIARSLSVKGLVLALVTAVLATLAVGMTATAAHAEGAARKVTAWIPYWDQSRAMQSFLTNADLYSAASPFWYELSAAGALSRYPGAEDATVLSGIRGQGVKVMPTITNNFDPARTTAILATDASRAAHVQLLVNLVQTMGYDGIDVDYESMAAGDRDRFTALVSSLSAALHANGKLLSLAVHPKTAEPGTWSGPQAQDYRALGAVADRFRIMTYDYSWATSPAGPVAPLSWVDQVAAFAASVVAPSKIELGMALYGYDWVASAGTGVEHDVATATLASTGATRVWDATAAEPTFSYSAGGANHTVYYADAQSVSARLALVDKHGLAGAAFWRLGGEDSAVWTAVRNRWSGVAPAPATSPSPTPTPAADVQAPTVPAGLIASAGPRRVYLTWKPSTDLGSGIAGYEVFRATAKGGTMTKIATLGSTSWTNTNLTANHWYWYAVRAYDRAGNRGALSATVSAVAR